MVGNDISFFFSLFMTGTRIFQDFVEPNFVDRALRNWKERKIWGKRFEICLLWVFLRIVIDNKTLSSFLTLENRFNIVDFSNVPFHLNLKANECLPLIFPTLRQFVVTNTCRGVTYTRESRSSSGKVSRLSVWRPGPYEREYYCLLLLPLCCERERERERAKRAEAEEGGAGGRGVKWHKRIYGVDT